MNFIQAISSALAMSRELFSRADSITVVMAMTREVTHIAAKQYKSVIRKIRFEQQVIDPFADVTTCTYCLCESNFFHSCGLRLQEQSEQLNMNARCGTIS